MSKGIMLTLTVIRRRKKMTQMDLARVIGVSQPEISYIEGSYFRPSDEILAEIAKILDFSDRPENLLLPYEEYLDEERGVKVR